MEAGVVAIFHPWQSFHPLFGHSTCETSQVHLNSPVDNLCLAVSLWVIGRTEFEFCSIEAEELAPKKSCKYGVPITYDGSGNPMQAKNSFKEDLSNLGGCIGVLDGGEVAILGKPINDHKDGSFSVGVREAINEIH
jgi:hypothetical protein